MPFAWWTAVAIYNLFKWSRIVLVICSEGIDKKHQSRDDAALCQRCYNRYDAGKRHANRKHRALAAAGQIKLFEDPKGPV